MVCAPLLRNLSLSFEFLFRVTHHVKHQKRPPDNDNGCRYLKYMYLYLYLCLYLYVFVDICGVSTPKVFARHTLHVSFSQLWWVLAAAVADRVSSIVTS